MGDLGTIGRFLLIAGLAVAGFGLLLIVAGRMPGLDRLGRLPGDVAVQRGPLTVFIPIVSSIVISVVLTIVLNVVLRR
jgi:hypothetical protein